MFNETSDELSLQCPYCPISKENKLSVNIEKGVFNCFRCGFSGSINKLARMHPLLFARIEDSVTLSTFKRLSAYVSANTKPVFGPIFEHLTDLECISEADPHYQYLIDRGWTDSLISLYRPLKSSLGKYANRVIIPVVDSTNTAIYFTARDITGMAKQKYLNPVRDKDFIFRSKTPLDSIFTDDAIICEGIFDCFKLPGACALLGKTLNKTQHKPLYEFLKQKKRIFICFDPGTETEAEKLAIELDSWFITKPIFMLNWVRDKTLSVDLGDLSKELSSKQLHKFITTHSVEPAMLKLM